VLDESVELLENRAGVQESRRERVYE